ncbi:MAG TPA: LCP family protein [Acidimicrobiia bacterium]|nr:LCP family protein [Acidimicrobiia bacterium]
MQDTAATPRRSGLPKWLKVTIISLLVLANVAVLGFIWVVNTGNNLFADARTDDEVTEVLDPANNGRRTILVVGSDTREGLDDLDNFGDFAGARGDVVMLVSVDPASNDVRMLSIPRDLWVSIPGHGENRINAAYSLGGPRLIVETVKQNLNVPINNYVEIDFVGFQALVDDLGGVDIEFPYAARDSKSGLDITAGTGTLNGEEALAYARARHYQEYRDGSWQSVEANDIGRTGRQQQVMKALIASLKSPSSVAEAGSIASTMSNHMTIDSNLANESVPSMVWDYKGIITGSIDGETLPTTSQTIGGRSVQVVKEPEASAVLASFRVGSSVVDAEPLTLEVLNGTSRDGAAGAMSERLEALGFTVDSIGNAGTNSYAETTVIVPEGSDSGSTITSALGFGVVEFGSVDEGLDAVVIVGSDAS